MRALSKRYVFIAPKHSRFVMPFKACGKGWSFRPHLPLALILEILDSFHTVLRLRIPLSHESGS
jgi:hypothetical protein